MTGRATPYRVSGESGSGIPTPGVRGTANKSLRWVCLGCGRDWKVEMPGFPGSTIGGHHWHVFDRDKGVNCHGPIVATIAKEAAHADA